MWAAPLPAGFVVKLRQPPTTPSPTEPPLAFYGPLYLAPGSLVVQWPFANDDADATFKTLAQKRDEADLDAVTELSPADLSPHGLWLDAFMCAADDAATKCPDAFRAAIAAGTTARDWIADRAGRTYGFPGTYPETLDVVPNERIETGETCWHLGSAGLTLELGMVPIKKKKLLMHEWPCGAFG